MQFLADLWIPILVSAVVVFVASSILHMVIPLHRGDYKKLPGEDAVQEAMRAQNVQPGQYMLPCPDSMKDMATPEMKAKYDKGPVGFMTVLPNGPPAMGKNLVFWFLYSIVVSFFVAYIGTLALAPDAEYLRVFRVTGAVAVLAYAFAPMVDSIWKGQRWSTTGKFVFDGIVYGLVTAGTFAWLWS